MAGLVFSSSKVKQYWLAVRDLARTLDSPAFITSLDEYARTIGAPPEVAAQRIIDKTHRIATRAEIDKCHADEKERARSLAAIEDERRHVNRVASTTVYEQARVALARKLDGGEE